MIQSHFILYVEDQGKSTQFYASVLGMSPVLHVPGMTEFELSSTSKLGLMPNAGIAKIIGDQLPDPSSGTGVPRAEVYLILENYKECFQRALDNGATLVSPIQERNWGHEVGYVADYDGHILAFARVMSS